MDFLVIARATVAEGITHILATLYYKMDIGVRKKRKTKRRKKIRKLGYSINFLLGQEVRIIGELMEDIQEDKIQLIGCLTATAPAFRVLLFLIFKGKEVH